MSWGVDVIGSPDQALAAERSASDLAVAHGPGDLTSPPPLEDADLSLLFRDHGFSCSQLARSIMRDPQLAEDVVQEVFLLHWRGSAWDPERSSLRRWLLMLTHRKAVDRVRHEELRRTASLDGIPEQTAVGRGPEEEALASALGPRVRQALAALPEVQRRVIVLAYWGGYKQREIAEMTSTPLGTVKTRMRNGMFAMRGALHDEHLARS